MEQLGKALVVVGLVVAALGVLLWAGAFRRIPLGRLPGDVSYERDGVSFYFPIVTMLVVSGVISLILWIVGALRK